MDIKDIKHSLPEFQRYARSHLSELMTIGSILLASISSWYGTFWGSAGWSFFMFSIAMAVGVLIPNHADKILKQIYRILTQRSKTGELVLGIVKMLIAIAIPWVIFAIVGILAGESYHYYTRPHRDSSAHNRAA